jgi:cytoskeleton protein RodZ
MNTPDDSAPILPPSASRGARLRAAREAAGLTPEAIAARLRLSLRQVLALENDDPGALPPAPFVRGFVRNYARALGRDAAEFDPLAGEVDSAAPVATPPSVALPPPRREIRLESGRASANRRWLIAALVALALGAVGSWFRMEQINQAGDMISRQTPTLSQLGTLVGRKAHDGTVDVDASSAAAAGAAASNGAPDSGAAGGSNSAPGAPGARAAGGANGAPGASAAGGANGAPGASAEALARNAIPAPVASPPAVAPTAARAAAPLGPPAAGPGMRKLELDFDAECWVEVRDENNRVLLSGVSRAGEHRDLEARGPVRIVVGNAPATHLSWNGRPVDLAEFTQVAVARLTLDPATERP